MGTEPRRKTITKTFGTFRNRKLALDHSGVVSETGVARLLSNKNTLRCWSSIAQRYSLVWVLWLLFISIVLVLKFNTEPSTGNVFHIYRQAGIRFSGGLDLYPASLFYFNYFPSSALFFSPFQSFSFENGGALWRAVNLVLFAAGVRALATLLPLLCTRAHQNNFLWLSLVSLACCWSAARYGQMTLAMTGIALLGFSALSKRQFWRSAVFLSLALALKPTALVFWLLIFVLYKPMRMPLSFSLAIFLLLPFGFQSTEYIIAQYQALPGTLSERVYQPDRKFANLFHLLSSIGIDFSLTAQNTSRALAAAWTLWLCRKFTIEFKHSMAVVLSYALASSYILLFGGGIEHNTYALLGPVLGVLLLLSSQFKMESTYLLLLTAFLLMLSSNTVMKSFPNIAVMAMLKPIACLMISTMLARAVSCSSRTDK